MQSFCQSCEVVKLTIDIVNSRQYLIALLSIEFRGCRQRFNAMAKFPQRRACIFDMSKVGHALLLNCRKLFRIQRRKQALRDPGNGSAQLIAIRAAMKQKIEVVNGFLMPHQPHRTNTGHGNDQQHRASE